MIHKVKTVTYEVRSHGFQTELSHDGAVDWWDIVEKIQDYMSEGNKKKKDKGRIKKMIMHLQDVLKCIKKIEREKEKANGTT